MMWQRGRSYSQDLRERVLTAQGSARQVAVRFEVSVSYVVKARQRQIRTGSRAPRPQKPPVVRLLVHLHEAIGTRMASVPDTTMADLRDWLLREHGVSASMGTVWNTLFRLGLTLKKVGSRQRTGACRHRPSPRRMARAAGAAKAGETRLP
jgi:transposase